MDPAAGGGTSPVSPGLTAGGGLKRLHEVFGLSSTSVSPGLTAGGGLKLARDCIERTLVLFPPASPPGAD